MSDPSTSTPDPALAPVVTTDSADAPPASAAPSAPAAARRGRSRVALYLAIFIVASLSGAALFVSGYTLGVQQSITPGTAAENQQLFEPFWEAWNKVTTQYVGTYDKEKLVEGSIKGMFDAIGDPFSSYMTSDEYKASLAGVSGEFEGIGAEMAAQDSTGAACTPVSATCQVVVVHVLRRSPALTAGLQDGDILLSIDSASVVGMTLDDVVAKVRGPKGVPVTLGLQRAGQPLTMTIVRDVVQSEDVTSDVIADGSIGYLKISSFGASVASDFADDLKDLVVTEGLHELVLDLRDDPGGFVDQALGVASEFIASGPVYWEENAAGQLLEHDSTPGGIATDPSIKLVLLVNAGSASASEIVAGALHDTGRATLVGVKTYGKGTIQQWQLLNGGDAGGFRLSIAKWLTPKQTWIHGVGITPDVVLPVPDGTPAGQDPQLDKAIQILSGGTVIIPQGLKAA